MNEKYCVYAKRKGLLGWLQGWVIVSVSDDDLGFQGGYSYDAYHMGMRLMRLKMRPPLPYSFWRVPEGAEVFSPVVEK